LQRGKDLSPDHHQTKKKKQTIMKAIDQVRWGVIGCGEATETKSGPALQGVEGSMIAAVMSRDKEKAKSYAQRHGIQHYCTDPIELINDRNVNAIYIATPPSSHATFALMAMKAGKPVYVEKPLASSYDECLRVNAVSEQTGIPCYVAYYRRYLPYFKKVEEIIHSKVIGKVLSVQIRFAVPPRELDYNKTNLPWRLQPDIAGGGGYFYDLASHQIDLLQHLFGEIIEAEGYATNMAGLYRVQDTFNACFRFAHGGLTGSGSWCFVAHDSARTDRIEIVGQQGMICFSVFDYTPIALHTKEGRQEFPVENPRHVQKPLIEMIVDDIRSGSRRCDCDSVSATTTNWVMDKILEKI